MAGDWVPWPGNTTATRNANDLRAGGLWLG
jgi:hypothetical protein